MSDAQGSNREPVTGGPNEEPVVDDAPETVGGADSPERAETAPAGDEPDSRSALPDAVGEDDATTRSATPPAQEVSPAAAAPAGDTRAARADRAGLQEDAAAGRAAREDTTPDGDREPDYAALAAELEEFERRNASANDSSTASAADGERVKGDPWFEPAQTQTFSAAEPEPAPAVTASEPVPDTSAPAAPVAPTPIFVQAPEPPKVRGNRGAAGLIGLVAAVVFAVLFFAAMLVERAVRGDLAAADIGSVAIGIATSFALWVPVVVFWLGFWLLGAVVNRARWGSWVVFGLLVGVVSYAGHILGQLFQAPFWMITATESTQLTLDTLLSPLAIIAFVLGREITIWFGAWAARRGAKVTAQNAEAQAEYERTLEAGPTLSA
ncbi:ABC transporter [Microbacterium betulae]|uniref:ABC transporter n=1 Tax=Microbacterium betulae TaxID=2981139 RepID=A0AA97FH47_9MICO|nr:ABC transporter [Microbacterium sp. AB]WOF22414.1 ABC transporter [Microbacterium sp. AB]